MEESPQERILHIATLEFSLEWLMDISMVWDLILSNGFL